MVVVFRVVGDKDEAIWGQVLGSSILFLKGIVEETVRHEGLLFSVNEEIVIGNSLS